ncbi:hypothetical protein [Streptomyces jumonjinensis]|uniref:Uncharacterized protein n=1 Tax=Streptomyces jumonjinensis TaxID=1945 RepID=A0A646KNJ4_STRJU|nr:hypothetical protein [Streptomyces jumonjinensis]MQT03862.1 hypothetical protein [Streptomyces jumonjinensis]
MARVYATSADYQTYTGQAPPADIGRLLAAASGTLDSRVLRLCRYDVDPDGYPTHQLVLDALAGAVCAQVEWGEEVGDTTGAAGVGWGNLKIGSVQLGRSVTATTGDDSPGRQIAPKVWDSLRSPDLTPDIFELGAVCS